MVRSRPCSVGRRRIRPPCSCPRSSRSRRSPRPRMRCGARASSRSSKAHAACPRWTTSPPPAWSAWCSARSTSHSTSTWTSPPTPPASAMQQAASPSPRAWPACRRQSQALRRNSTTRHACCPILRKRDGSASARSCAFTRARYSRSTPRCIRAPQALDWAQRVLAADAASPGVARLDGRMVDRPVVLQAQRTMALART